MKHCACIGYWIVRSECGIETHVACDGLHEISDEPRKLGASSARKD